MPYIGSTPAATALVAGDIANDAIDSQHYTDGSVDTAHIADNQITTAKISDNAITLAKLAGGTDGNIISFDASGDPVAVATGSDGQVLTSTGAGSPPAFEAAASGAWTFVSSATPSAAAAFNVTGFTSGFDFCIVFRKCSTSAGGAELQCRVIQSSTAQTSSDYGYAGIIANNNARRSNDNQSSWKLHEGSTGGQMGVQFSGHVYSYTPKTAGIAPHISWSFGGEQDDSTHGYHIGWGEYDQDTLAIDGLNFFDSAGGNFGANGTVSVYKRQSE